MIESLRISNYALISSIDIEFSPHFNIITGETGAGKSIILGALSLILGGRADMSAIRDNSRKTVVEATFDISALPHIDTLIQSYGIDSLMPQCILRREITVRGGSRAFINDTPVNLSQLRAVALQLIDIHSQHQNQLLATPEYQMSIIDALAGNDDLLKDYGTAFDSYREALGKYKNTRDTILRSRNDADFIAYQLEQLNELDIHPGEQQQLESERDILLNTAQITRHLDKAGDALDGERPVTAALTDAIDSILSLSDIYDDISELADRLMSAKIEIQDVSDSLAEYRAKIDGDADRLDEVENRLGSIYSMQAKHHVDTGDALITLRDRLQRQMQILNDGDAILATLEDEAKRAKKAAITIARQISERRHVTAEAFAVALRDRAMPMGLPNLRVEIALSQSKLQPSGIDNVEFMVAFNKNQSLSPIGKTASGGETSRLILAIKSVVAEKMNLPTMIFDEVDTGVSGDIANRMAELMAGLSRRTQVITITHLPQVAARGDIHFKVFKQDTELATETHLSVLDDEARVTELALMLSGSPDNPASRATAASLLGDKGQANLFNTL